MGKACARGGLILGLTMVLLIVTMALCGPPEPGGWGRLAVYFGWAAALIVVNMVFIRALK